MTAGNLESQKQRKAHSPTQLHTHTESLSTLTRTLFVFVFLFCWVCSDGAHMIPSPLFSVYPSSFYLVFPSFLSLEPAVQRGVEACSFPKSLTAPVCVCVCVCGSKFFQHCSHSPVFLNLASCIFIAFVFTDILPLFFPLSSVF